MEIRVRPRRASGRRVLVRAALVAAVLLAVALLAPAALGFRQHAVNDEAMAGSYPRGSLVLAEDVEAQLLVVGDVIAFRAPVENGDGPWVLRRVIDVDGDRLTTRADAAAEIDPWLLSSGDTELQVVAHAVPWLGYPWLVVGAAGPLLGGLLLGGLLLVARMRRHSRTGVAVRSARPAAGSAPGATPV